jgi:glutaconyl-CoA/methylmalonyl-CoA decarboxylase subunit gamma
MKRLYKIKLGDKIYDVEVEEITPPEQKRNFSGIYKSFDLSPITLQKKVSTSSKQSSLSSGSVDENTVTSPMSGSIISIDVQQGNKVKEGDLLLKLEAMKMETSINAPKDGEVKEINCKVGQSVSAGDPLLKLE